MTSTLLLLTLLLPLAAAAAEPASLAVANRPVVNMYSRASDDADVVSQAIFGTNVDVLEASGDWWKIRTPDAYTGWVLAAQFVRRTQPYGLAGQAVQVDSLFAHLYREKSVTRHAPLMTLPFETRLEPGSSQDERWLEVVLPDGRTAWVQTGDIIDTQAKLGIESMLYLSRRFLGLPYTWGGTSSFGFDCSGFTQMLLRSRDILMPRDAHLQAAWDGVVAVDDYAAQPGDLLFFGSSLEKITHTGMYLGDGDFIHATTHQTPVVQISRMSDPYWKKLLVCVRRPK